VRSVDSRYVDPLDHIWLSAAAKLGLRVERSPLGYATTDGKGTLSIAPPDELDADDCLAQIILHELCHALVQGEDSFSQPDWGLHNDASSAAYEGDTVREQATLRVQAALLRRHGLRKLLGPTTEFRRFYDALPRDPLRGEAPGVNDPALLLAHAGLARAARPPFHKVLSEALSATAQVHQALPRAAQAYDARAAQGASGEPAPQDGEAPLWLRAPAPALHKSGLPMHDGVFAAERGATCRDCGACTAPQSPRGSWRCERTATDEKPGLVVDPAAAACALHSPAFDCQVCAACCRHAYELVPVGRNEPLAARFPHLCERQGKVLTVRRDRLRKRCAALDGPEGGPYGCAIYSERPSTCRDFTAGSKNCIDARRRVGLEV
jgi:hypothetical protein